MSERIADQTLARHILLHEFDRESIATKAAKNICAIYGQVISERQSERWFERFESGDRSLENCPKNVRPKIVGYSVVKNRIESFLRQPHREMS